MTNDVVSLPIAKKLKEAGWRQTPSSFVYRNSQFGWSEVLPGNGGNEEWCAAPTIAEILETLPVGTRLVKGLAFANYIALAYEEEAENERWTKNPADACALLWMALKEKGIV